MNDRPDPYRPSYPPDAETVPMTNDMLRSPGENPAYAERQREPYQNPPGNQFAQQSRAYEDRNMDNANLRRWIATLIYFLLGVVEAIMGLRFIFRLLGANEGNSFIMFLYSLSLVFVSPFDGIFNDQAIGNRSVFETSTLVAMLIYALIAWGLASLGRVIFSSK